MNIEQLHRLCKRIELQDLLNNCVDDDEAILLRRELGIEEVKQDYPEGEE